MIQNRTGAIIALVIFVAVIGGFLLLAAGLGGATHG